MRIRVLQHVAFEGPAALESWFRRRNATLTTTRLFAGEPLPHHDDYDGLVVLGGPMSVKEEFRFPWLKPEKQAIAEAIGQGKTVLGVCLGAQLIANALGAQVRRNPDREIGWHPVFHAPGAGAHPLGRAFPVKADAFHWHGETFELPKGSTHLLTSAACTHQAFAVGEHVLGLQCHFETTPDAALTLVENCRDEIVSAPFIQSETEILGTPERFARLNAVLDRVLSVLWPH